MTLRLVAALLAVYVIWGSTYLAIAVAVEGLPPLTAAGLRFLPAGVLLLGWCGWRGVRWPTGRQWRHGLLVGVLMLGFGNGLVCVAEQHVASGMTAAIIAVAPILVVGLPWLAGGPRPSGWTIAGVLTGLAGVAGLSAGLGSGGHAPWWAVACVILATLSWVGALLLMPRLDLPEDLLMRSGMPMLLGGGSLLAVGAALGEPWRLTAGPALAPALAATGYLIVFGSLVAYTSYLWLQRHASPGLATSNVYVNPVIAIALGAWLRDEPLDLPLMAGCLVILVAVIMLTVDDVRRRAVRAP